MEGDSNLRIFIQKSQGVRGGTFEAPYSNLIDFPRIPETAASTCSGVRPMPASVEYPVQRLPDIGALHSFHHSVADKPKIEINRHRVLRHLLMLGKQFAIDKTSDPFSTTCVYQCVPPGLAAIGRV